MAGLEVESLTSDGHTMEMSMQLEQLAQQINREEHADEPQAEGLQEVFTPKMADKKVKTENKNNPAKNFKKQSSKEEDECKIKNEEQQEAEKGMPDNREVERIVKAVKKKKSLKRNSVIIPKQREITDHEENQRPLTISVGVQTEQTGATFDNVKGNSSNSKPARSIHKQADRLSSMNIPISLLKQLQKANVSQVVNPEQKLNF